VLRQDAIANDYVAVPHEFTHILMRHPGPQWMQEGLATYMQERFPAGSYRGVSQNLADSTIPAEDCPDCILTFFDWTDLEIQFHQHQDSLDTGTREQVLQELSAVYRAFDRKDTQAMQQHLERARQLLEAEINE